MHVRCPHCRNPVELVDDGALEDVNCPSCGSSFSLVGGDTTATYTPDSTESIGHFTLSEKLGLGAFGTVWKAEDTELDRTVAIKIPRKGQLDQAESEKFLREARTAAQLKHPNIVGVHEVGKEGDTLYIVSDLIEGVTLTDWLTGQQPTFREASELCVKIADALHHAHEHGVIHRDLKPGNILLDRNHVPHLTDFGLAKREAGEITMTVDGQVLGTPAYMSPEQARGEGHQVDRRADIYSLGVVLFELLTGERPFRGNTQMLIHQLITEDAPSPRKLNAAIPKDLETICLKCLEKNPDRRFETAEEFQAELQRWLDGESILSRPISRVARGWRWCKRKPVVAGLSALLLISLTAGIAVSSYYAAEADQKANGLAKSLEVEKRLVSEKTGLLSEKEALLGQKSKLLEDKNSLISDLKKSEQAVKEEAAIAKAVNRFLQDDLLSQSSPDVEPDRDIKLRTVLDRAAASVEGRFKDQPMIEAEIQVTISNVYLELGEVEKAEQHMKRSIQLYENNRGKEHPSTLNCQTRLAAIFTGQGRYQEAEILSLDILERARRILGAEHRVTLGAQSILAACYSNTGRVVEAEKLFLQTLAAQRRIRGDSHVDTQVTRGNLAGFYTSRLGRDSDAVPLFQELLEDYRRTLGNEHPNTLIAQNSLASTYVNMGQYDLAEPLYLETYEIMQRILGDEHHETLLCHLNLAANYVNQERFDEAKQIYDESLATLERIQGKDHPNILSVKQNLASLLLAQGHFKDAEEIYRQILEVQRKQFGNENRETLTTMSLLARFYFSRRQYDKAEILWKNVLETSQRMLGAEDEVTLIAHNDLAVLYAAMQRFDEAEKLYLQFLDGYRKKHGGQHPRALSCQSNLADLYADQKRYDEAKELYQQTLEGLRREFGVHHAYTKNCLTDFIKLYFELEQYDDAEQLYVDTLKASQVELGEEHPYTLELLTKLVNFSISQKNYDTAARYCIQKLETQRSSRGVDDPATLDTEYLLVNIYSFSQQHEKTKQLLILHREHFQNRFGTEHEKTSHFQRLLASLHTQLGEHQNAEILYRELAESARSSVPGSLSLAHNLELLAKTQITLEKYVEAEANLRESLALREEKSADELMLLHSMTPLREALEGQQNYDEAENVALRVFEICDNYEKPFPGYRRSEYLSKVVQRLINLYTVWDKPDQAEVWKQKQGEIDRADQEYELLVEQAQQKFEEGQIKEAIVLYDQAAELPGQILHPSSIELYARTLQTDKIRTLLRRREFVTSQGWKEAFLYYQVGDLERYRAIRKVRLSKFDFSNEGNRGEMDFRVAIMEPLEPELRDAVRQLAQRNGTSDRSWVLAKVGKGMYRLGEFREWYAALPEDSDLRKGQDLLIAITNYQSEPTPVNKVALVKRLKKEEDSLAGMLKDGVLGKYWFDYGEQNAWVKEAKSVLENTPVAEPEPASSDSN